MGTIFIEDHSKNDFFCYELVYQMEGGRLYLLSFDAECKKVLDVLLGDAFAWDFRASVVTNLEKQFSEKSKDHFFYSARNPKGNSTLITFHTEKYVDRCIQYISESLVLLDKVFLEAKLEEIFQFFSMVCIWNLDNNPTIYVKSSDVLTSRLSKLEIPIKYVEKGKLPVW